MRMRLMDKQRSLKVMMMMMMMGMADKQRSFKL
jgi:hypothetical protein